MALTPGTRLGVYEVTAAIGAGGMGEVYRARDTRLGRDVAIKVLPDEFARDPERMRRFDQEARAVAALNHPNVVSVFDTGQQDGVPYLVTELLEGETLRDIVARGPLPARKVADYARQIADGLAAAHEKNIVHRDLKPENLYLTNGGRVKILDFGVAKVRAVETAALGAATMAATLAPATGAGVVLGTSGYMAPEQVRGETVDHRADIFSFGATLYELLTGQRAFHGASSVETLNAILKDEPLEVDAERLRGAPGLERIIRHCLEKKSADRFQSSRDLLFALSALSETSTSTQARPSSPARRPIWMFGAVALAGAAVIAGALVWTMSRGQAPERSEFAISVPGEVSHVAIAQDGRWLALVSPGDSGRPMVYVNRIGSPEVRAIAGTEDASYPFWSPDGTQVAFFANGKLRKVPVAGGGVQNITTVGAAPRGGTWGSQNVILYAREVGGGLWRVNSDGTGAAPLTDKLFARSESSHRFPFFLPDGDHFLMYAGNFGGDDAGNGVYLSSVSKLEKVALVKGSKSAAAIADGRIYYVDVNGALVAVPVDINKGTLTGAPRTVAAHAARSPSTYYAAFAIASNSTLVYSASDEVNHSQPTWFDNTGKELGHVGPVGVTGNLALSPDGRRVATDSNDFKAKNVDVWIVDVAGDGSSRFTFDPSEDVTPVWSRDGARIAFRTIRGVASQIAFKRADGSGTDTLLAALEDSGGDILPNSWVPDGSEILCTLDASKGPSELVLQPTDGGKLKTFLRGSSSATNGQISPDGKWVAYASNETGFWEIYVTTFPGASGKWQISRGGGAEPRWRGDGRAIFFIGPNQVLTETAVATDGTFSAGAPRALFQIHPRAPISSSDLFNYDVTPDGKRFLVNEYVKPAQAAQLSIVFHASAPK